MKARLKQPRYVFPIIALPFLILFFYLYQDSFQQVEVASDAKAPEMQSTVGSVSKDVNDRALTDKLDAYLDDYKQADGYTAVNALEEETVISKTFNNSYTDRQKYRLDSLEQLMSQKKPSSITNISKNTFPDLMQQRHNYVAANREQDQALADALNRLSKVPESKPEITSPDSEKSKDPMEVFKMQMKYMDSVSKAADPDFQEQLKRDKLLETLESNQKNQIKLPVIKYRKDSELFNTVRAERQQYLISAMIDENLTAYSGSRIRLRLLEPITAGKNTIPKGTLLYAKVSGFSEQRVTLAIESILLKDKILPVKLELYDLDGHPGLYVPESAFREFTKELGGNSMQGVSLQGNSENQNQFIMSTIDRAFQSTSAAITRLIRKNKAKIKYSTYIYLVDPQLLKEEQKSF